MNCAWRALKLIMTMFQWHQPPINPQMLLNLIMPCERQKTKVVPNILWVVGLWHIDIHDLCIEGTEVDDNVQASAINQPTNYADPNQSIWQGKYKCCPKHYLGCCFYKHYQTWSMHGEYCSYGNIHTSPAISKPINCKNPNGAIPDERTNVVPNIFWEASFTCININNLCIMGIEVDNDMLQKTPAINQPTNVADPTDNTSHQSTHKWCQP